MATLPPRVAPCTALPRVSRGRTAVQCSCFARGAEKPRRIAQLLVRRRGQHRFVCLTGRQTPERPIRVGVTPQCLCQCGGTHRPRPCRGLAHLGTEACAMPHRGDGMADRVHQHRLALEDVLRCDRQENPSGGRVADALGCGHVRRPLCLEPGGTWPFLQGPRRGRTPARKVRLAGLTTFLCERHTPSFPCCPHRRLR